MGWRDTIKTTDASAGGDQPAPAKSWRDTIVHAEPAEAPPPDDPGVLDDLKAAGKSFVDGLSMPASMADAGERLTQNGLFRAKNKEPAPDSDGKVSPEAALATAKANSGNSAAPFPLFGGGGLGSAAARVGSGSALAGADAGLKNPDKAFDTEAAFRTARLAALLGLAGEGAGAVAGKAAPAVNDFAENRAASAMGWTKAMRKKFGKDAALDAGRVGLDEGVVTPFASTANKIERMQGVQEAAGKTIGDTMDTLDQAGIKEFVPGDTAMVIDSQLGNKYAGEPLFKGQANQYENLIDTVLKRGDGPTTFSAAQDLKKMIGDYGWEEGVAVPGREQAQQAYGIVNKGLDEAVERGATKLGNPDLLAKLQKARGNYGAADKTVGALEGKQAAELGNNQFSLTDAALAAPALATPHGLAKAAINVGARHLAARYGNNLAAVTADGLSKILSTEPGTFGQYAAVLASAAKRGPDSLLAAHHTLLKTDPNYAKQLGGDEGAK